MNELPPKMRLCISSPPDREKLVAEIFYKDTQWAELNIPYRQAKALWWQAQAALPIRAKRAEARKALLAAWSIATDLPATPLQRALVDLSIRGRIALPGSELVAIPVAVEPKELVAVGPGRAKVVDFGLRVAGSGSAGSALSPAEEQFGLSPRENSVLLVLAEGRTNREIAERLFISERTVAVHVRRILSKLGVGGRTEAAGMAIRLGLVPNELRTPVGSRQTPASRSAGA